MVAATIAQAGAIGNQEGGRGGWLSNLQRFETYDPPALKGE